jgi:predicted aspartyl protease
LIGRWYNKAETFHSYFPITKVNQLRYHCAMGTFTVKAKLKNWDHRKLPPGEQAPEVACNMLVDKGCGELALPSEVIEQLQLEPLKGVVVDFADGTKHVYRIFGIVELEVQGRTCTVRAVELPRGTEPLLGAVPLEHMDWHLAPNEGKLLPNPKSPDEPLIRI